MKERALSVSQQIQSLLPVVLATLIVAIIVATAVLIVGLGGVNIMFNTLLILIPMILIAALSLWFSREILKAVDNQTAVEKMLSRNGR